MRGVLRNNGLTLVMFGLFAVSLIGQSVTGWRSYDEDQRAHGEATVGFGVYLRTGHFVEAVFENWESEFLQMGVYVLLTAFLFQKGSSESKDPDGREAVDEDPREARGRPDAPWPVRRGGVALRLYEHSLTVALFALFALAFVLHAEGGARAYGEERLAHGEPAPSTLAFLGSAQFWFESFQNWQSEFLSVGVLVVLSVFLRERDRPSRSRWPRPTARPAARPAEGCPHPRPRSLARERGERLNDDEERAERTTGGGGQTMASFPWGPDEAARLDAIRDELAGVSTASACQLLIDVGWRNAYARGLLPLAPLGLGRRIVGRARTCRYLMRRGPEGPPDPAARRDSAEIVLIEAIEPGDVFCVDALGVTTAGIIGDILATRLLARGAAAAVIHGAVRDAPYVKEVGLPVFAAAVHPSHSGRDLVPVNYDRPIDLAGAQVLPGDVLLADDEGVIAMPLDLAEYVAAHGPPKERLEEWIRAKIAGGGSVHDYYPPSPEKAAEYARETGRRVEHPAHHRPAGATIKHGGDEERRPAG